jgi:hypothetical protein
MIQNNRLKLAREDGRSYTGLKEHLGRHARSILIFMEAESLNDSGKLR